jgi:uncharacterized phage protein (TIGR02218 family)
MITDSDRGAILIRRRTARPRVVAGLAPTIIGYEQFEISEAVTAIPVEGYQFLYGATTVRHTSADRNQTFAAGTFTPATIARGDIAFSQEDNAQNVNVTVPKSHPIAQLFVNYNPPQKVALTIFRKHRSATEEIVIFVGTVLTCTFEGPQATLVCGPLTESFRRIVPSIAFQTQCAWALYGPGCQVVKASFKTSGFVLAVNGIVLAAAAFAGKPDGWFANGWAELPNGERQYIISHAGNTVILQAPFQSITLGGAIDAFAGCDRSEATCAGKFDNLIRHLGFPRIPTRNPFDGSLV